MKKRSILRTALFLIAATGIHGITEAQKPIQFVDPLIGAGGHGHVFVGASVPFGAVQVGPNNIYKGWDWCSGYNYSDKIVDKSRPGIFSLHLASILFFRLQQIM